MADIKVSDMTEASSVGDNDLLMIVQGGASKKVKASKFVRVGDQVSDAQTLDGHTADDFLGAEEQAADSAKLGGHPATDYAKVSDIPSMTDPTWCAMKIWHKNIEDPNATDAVSTNLRNLNYVVCDGRQLSVSAYQELFGIIGHSYTPASEVSYDDTKFRIPDMRGRFPLGANVEGTANHAEINTQCLPTGLYNPSGVATPEWTSGGQWKAPQAVGVKGGSFEVTQETDDQMALHRHNFTGLQRGQEVKPASEGGAYRVTGANPTNTTDPAGSNQSFKARFPQAYEEIFNYSQLSVQPFVSFCYIMKLKP